MKSNIIIFLILFIGIRLASSQTNTEKEIFEVENNLLPFNIFEGETPYSLKDRMEFYQVPGVSITVIKDYEILWTKHYGYSDNETKQFVTDQTLFNVGSLSKGATSLTVLSLIQEGVIGLDDDVNTHLRSWKIPKNEFTDSSAVTPRLLMNHTSGAMHHYGLNYTRDNFPSITQYLKGELPARERPTIIDKVPGTEFRYSNPGYAILQQLIEDVTGKDLYKVAEENVFELLDMNQTTFQQPLTENIEKHASAGHRNGATPMPVKRYFYPNTAAGGLWTTTEDYAKFIIEIMKSYHGKSNKIISKDLVEEMLKPHATDIYGLGVFLRNIGGHEYFGHMGDNAGFFAGYLAHMSDGYGVIVFTNSNSSPELIREINKAVAKVYNWPNFLPEEISKVETSDNELKSFSGRYKTGSDNLINIDFKDGNLYLKNLENAALFHIGDNTFKVKRRDGEIQFLKDSEGNITHAEYHFADEIGRISDNRNKAVKLKEDEKIPSEYLEAGNIDKAIELYSEIFKDSPNDPAISESRLNRMGYSYLYQKKYDEALTVLKLNTEFYPASSNCFDSYGEALVLSGKKEEAIKSYQRAIELDPDAENSKTCLKKLLNENIDKS